MKLVEILARELKEWPEGQVARQDQDMEICFEHGDASSDFMASEMAGDNITNGSIGLMHVTRPQWQAERERVEKMEKIESGMKQGDADLERMKEWARQTAPMVALEPYRDYNQELWDKVAGNCYSKYAHKNADRRKCASWAFSDADAFMAERAKRLHKG